MQITPSKHPARSAGARVDEAQARSHLDVLLSNLYLQCGARRGSGLDPAGKFEGGTGAGPGPFELGMA